MVEGNSYHAKFPLGGYSPLHLMAEHFSSTCWVEIQGAAAGDPAVRDRFARRYAPVIRAYLGARWNRDRRSQEIEDAVQDVFVELFKAGGALQRVDSEASGGFRGFLYGITRNVALRVEQNQGRRREVEMVTGFSQVTPGPSDGDLAQVFDRAWAKSVMKDAWEVLEERSAAAGETGRRRLALLRARTEDGKPIRDIAVEWQADPDFLHDEYAAARKEFKKALRQVVEYHVPGAKDRVDQECQRLLEILRSE